MITVSDMNFIVGNLDYNDILKMSKLQEDIVLRGKVDHDNEVWVIWKCHVCEENSPHELLTYSTVFPLRLGIAIQQWYKLYFDNCHKCCKSMTLCI